MCFGYGFGSYVLEISKWHIAAYEIYCRLRFFDVACHPPRL